MSARDELSAMLSKLEAENGHLKSINAELVRMVTLFEKSIVYQINVATSEGDQEGANLKGFTLLQVRSALARAKGDSPTPTDGGG